MINKNQAIQLVNEFLQNEITQEEWFKKIKPSIKAFILYGSVAKGTNEHDSDIDILIILPIHQEENYTLGEYVYLYKNTEINIVLRSIEKLRLIAGEKTDVFQKEVFRESVLLKDFDGEVTELLKEIALI